MKNTFSTLGLLLLLSAPLFSAEPAADSAGAPTRRAGAFSGPFARVDGLVAQFNEQYAETLSTIKAGPPASQGDSFKMPDFTAEKEALAKDRAALEAWKPAPDPEEVAREKINDCIKTEDPRQTYGKTWRTFQSPDPETDLAHLVVLVTLCKSLARREEPLSCQGAGPLLNMTPPGAAEPTVRTRCEELRASVQKVRYFVQGPAKFRAICPQMIRGDKEAGPLFASLAPKLDKICEIAASWNQDPKAGDKLTALLGKEHAKQATILRTGMHKMAGRYPPASIPKDLDADQAHALVFSYHANKAGSDPKACSGNSMCTAMASGDLKSCDTLERAVRSHVCARYSTAVGADPTLGQAVLAKQKEKEVLEQRVKKQAEMLETRSRVAALQFDLMKTNDPGSPRSFPVMVGKKMSGLRQTLDDAIAHLNSIEPKSMGGITSRRAHLLKLQQRLTQLQQFYESSSKKPKPVPKPAARQ